MTVKREVEGVISKIHEAPIHIQKCQTAIIWMHSWRTWLKFTNVYGLKNLKLQAFWECGNKWRDHLPWGSIGIAWPFLHSKELHLHYAASHLYGVSIFCLIWGFLWKPASWMVFLPNPNSDSHPTSAGICPGGKIKDPISESPKWRFQITFFVIFQKKRRRKNCILHLPHNPTEETYNLEYILKILAGSSSHD